MEKLELLIKVKQVLSKPDLSYNLSGQLSAALDLLNTDAHKALSLDFVEHVLWICNVESSCNNFFDEILIVMRGFLKGKETINQVKSARSRLYDFRFSPKQELEVLFGTGYVVNALEEAILVCSGKELWQVGLIRYPRNDYNTVHRQAAFAVARHTAKLDWDSTDSFIRNQGRRIGKQASEKEKEWQIGHLIEYLENTLIDT